MNSKSKPNKLIRKQSGDNILMMREICLNTCWSSHGLGLMFVQGLITCRLIMGSNNNSCRQLLLELDSAVGHEI